MMKEIQFTPYAIYSIVGSLLLAIGIPLVIGGLFLMTITDIGLEYFSLPSPELFSLNERDSWLVNSTQTILEVVKKQSLETKHTEGIAITAIGAGLTLSSIPLIFESWRYKREFQKSQNFIRVDLEGINNKLVTAIYLIREAKKDLNADKNIINKLISKELTPLEIFSTMVTGLFFDLWESYATTLREFTINEQQILNHLHGFIINSAQTIQPREDSIVLRIEEILNSQSTDKSQEIVDFLKPIIESNLNSYEKIHAKLHEELNKITWIKNLDWKTVSDVEQKMTKISKEKQNSEK